MFNQEKPFTVPAITIIFSFSLVSLVRVFSHPTIKTPTLPHKQKTSILPEHVVRGARPTLLAGSM